jgi:hypothetical protein
MLQAILNLFGDEESVTIIENDTKVHMSFVINSINILNKKVNKTPMVYGKKADFNFSLICCE